MLRYRGFCVPLFSYFLVAGSVLAVLSFYAETVMVPRSLPFGAQKSDSQKHTIGQRHCRHRACIRRATVCRPLLRGGSDVGEAAAMPYASTANPFGFRRYILRSPGDLGRAPVLCVLFPASQRLSQLRPVI